ncbi:MAG TPA: PIG-L family deacetylase [Acidimicrobiales bacterium]|nr:PIG-L family deacetylase [Acidimicrobiales bacterium]
MPNPLTLMAVHAHPDDESSSTGGVLALYADQGIRTVVVTCTNGELGDAPGGIKPGEPGHDEAEVAAIRRRELDAACQILGVDVLERLGYHDSGMADWEFKGRPDAFCNVPIGESAGRLVALIEKYEPQVLITYDADSGYDHPDHVQASRITVAAMETTATPAKLYFTARRWQDFEQLRRRMVEMGIDVGPRPQIDQERLRRMEESSARITTTVDTTAVADRKRAALRAHASQLAESWFAKIPEVVFDEVFAMESFIRDADRTGAPLPEHDLFAGLRQ